MSQLDEILNRPEYFYCEKEHCRLRFEICLKRQKANQERSPFKPIPFVSCEGCDQGARNQLLKTSVAMNPKRGKGERNISCEHYSECLDLAARKDWKTFNCEGCSSFKAEIKEVSAMNEKEENTRICEKCGKNPTIQPNSPLCASCIGKQAWKDGKAKKKRPPKKKVSASTKRKDTTQAQGRRESEIVDSGRNMEVVFKGKYGQVLKEVEKLAEEEIRTVDEQIVYIIKTYLSNTQHLGAIK